MDHKDYYIPQHLDIPTRYAFFTMDELLVIIVPMAFGIFINQFVGSLILGGILLVILRKVKQGTSISQIYDRAYWLLPAKVFNFKDTPGSELRDLAG